MDYIEALRRRLAHFSDIGLLSLASLLAAGTAFVVNLISARVLGPEARGEVALVLQLAYLVGPVLSLGLDKARLRSAGRSGSKEVLVGSRIAALKVAVFVAPCAVLVFGWWAALCVPIALVTGSFQIHRSNAIAFGQYRRFFSLFSAWQASILVGTVLLAIFGVRSWQFWALVYALPGVLILLYRWQPEGGGRSAFRALGNNWAFVGAAVSQMLVARGERILLAGMVGSYDLGLYVVVATATEPLYWVSQALADKRTASALTLGGWASRLRSFGRDLSAFSVAGALGGILLYALIVPLFGVAYTPSKDLVLPLVVASVALALYRQAAGAALRTAGERNLGIAEGSLGVLAIAVYFLFITKFGVMGAAWGSAFVYVIAAITLFALSALTVGRRS